jgi:DNA-3-methyladenine glycosylase I
VAVNEVTSDEAFPSGHPSGGLFRCEWAGSDPLMVAYHDEEWGVPCHDDRDLFERLILEGFQAGLSWSTILRKRQAFIRAFDDFEPAIVAAYGPDDVARLLGDAGIVRNRLKVAAAISNAQAFLETRESFGSFDAYVWQFAPTGRGPRPGSLADIPATTAESDAMSKDLKRRGFRFVGSTICYAFMQSAGLVDDHVESCFRATAPQDV